MMRFIQSVTIGLFAVFIYQPLAAQKEQDILDYIATYKDIAIREMQRTGVPAAIKLAQGIHETQAGKSDLVQRSNNHFGIKCKDTWKGDRVYHDDDARDECFRRYTRSEDSYIDHSDFLKSNQRYAFLFALDPTDYEGWAYGLRKAGYATNIRYSQILIALIKNYHLEDYSMIALGKMNEGDHVVATASTPGLTRNQPVAIIPDLTQQLPEDVPVYPVSEFQINGTRVIFAKANTAWLSLVEKYRISKSTLWDFNDLEVDDDELMSDQLVFLQRKRKIGATPFHVVKRGESNYIISQSEGIRYESLLALNHLKGDQEPAVGERLYLQATSPSRPVLATENKPAVISNPGQINGYTPPVPKPATPTFEQSAQPLFTMHIVESKETLYSISKKFAVSVDQLVEWNKLDSLSVRVGQSLIVAKK